MPNRTCLVCGTEWIANDRSLTCSRACWLKRNADKAAARRQPRPPKVRYGTCSKCRCRFVAAQRGVIASVCPECRSPMAGQLRSGTCEVCGDTFAWDKPGIVPKACPAHQVERVRRWQKDYNRRTYSWQPVVALQHCSYPDCCNFFVRTKANRNQKFCPWCKALRIRDQQTAWRAGRVAGARLKRYGLTVDRYEAMLASQQHRCAVCGTDEPGGMYKNWHIDHDHSCCPGNGSCGQCVRGLLCNNCNLAAGYLRDDPARAKSLAEYLTR